MLMSSFLLLQTPNEFCPTPGPGKGDGGKPGTVGENCWPLGNILIVDENGNDIPDDAVGGDITFTFANPVEMLSIDQLDNEGSEDYQMEVSRQTPLTNALSSWKCFANTVASACFSFTKMESRLTLSTVPTLETMDMLPLPSFGIPSRTLT